MLPHLQHTHQPAIEGLTAAWTMVVLAFWTWLVMVARLGNGNEIFRLGLGDMEIGPAWGKTTSQAEDRLRVERSMSCPGTAGDIPGQTVPAIEVPRPAYIKDEASNVKLFR
ncbi:hypothetical protein BO83DRAFT_355724 [Aspergillus eucalypticola CBS 122712]|uniref:Uncharacterized protein n=1 Tax=Aspergillus eucalypticola (strain CBS 122712 / IBT 29274) TaxID=1448314 RepID=A0A317W5A5_ASPEC|nr:uncharacterized protein BO83DRAFT_355724 [Aspergillus eucalypticola CBS 122712]PWY80228.1 hypothetical protein BO83DRAFT_355724 [Aspergillus eucalypticola CBS 122712]